MAAQVASDESHDFKKLFSPFWFFLYYLMGYPLRVLGCFLDGFVIYWLVYDVRESGGQAWFAAIVGAILIQVVLGLSTTVSAKNLFRGLLFRSVAYAMMFLITAGFAGGSLYSTLYLSRNGSSYAVEAFAPNLKPVKTESLQAKSNEAVNRLATQQAQEVATLTKANDQAKAELTQQIKAAEKTIRKYQRIVDGYAEGATVPWKYRSPIFKGQKSLKKLNAKLLSLTTKHQDNLADVSNRQSAERTLARKAGLASLDEVKTENRQKAQKLDVYGLLAVGGNVGINLLSFFIMLGYELFLKFSEERHRMPSRHPMPVPKPTQSIDESAEKSVAQETQESGTGINANTGIGAGITGIGLPIPIAIGIGGLVNQETETNYFPYDRHRKNARMSYARSFHPAKDATTTLNRMATAQQHINALLWHGFDVSMMETDRQRLVVDALSKPTLEKESWECVVRLNREGVPVLEKFEVV